jgi:hypothetical protein
MLTPEREKYLRTRIEGEESIGWDGVKDLLAEIDRLRAELQSFADENETLLIKLQVAEEALDFAMRNARVCGHDDPSWCNSTCRVVWEIKNALKTIQAKELR